MNWNDPEDLEGQGPDEPADSRPANEGDDAGAADPDQERERMIAENKRLRDELRATRAESLVREYRLLPSHRDVLAATPRDRQHELAVELAAELEQHAESYDPDLSPPRPAPTGGPSGGYVAGDAPNPTPAGPTVRTGGSQPDESSRFADPEGVEQIRNAKGWQDLEAARNDMIRRRQEQEAGAAPMDPAKASEGATTVHEYFSRLEAAKQESIRQARGGR